MIFNSLPTWTLINSNISANYNCINYALKQSRLKTPRVKKIHTLICSVWKTERIMQYHIHKIKLKLWLFSSSHNWSTVSNMSCFMSANVFWGNPNKQQRKSPVTTLSRRVCNYAAGERHAVCHQVPWWGDWQRPYDTCAHGTTWQGAVNASSLANFTWISINLCEPASTCHGVNFRWKLLSKFQSTLVNKHRGKLWQVTLARGSVTWQYSTFKLTS